LKTLSPKELQLSQDQEWELESIAAGGVSVIGNVELFKTKKLGLLCSVRCPAKIILKTHDHMQVLGRNQTVISGFHSPVEKEALKLLLRMGSSVILCPARSLIGYRVPRAFENPLADGTMLIVSMFKKTTRKQNAALAYRRNKFVAVVSDIMLIPFADKRSKTLELVRFMIAKGKKVSAFDDPENSHLFQLGVARI
jgi:predicted Rossmann fold nucleotide-binding protein DprA/Smf involved in DNA uptake